MSCWRKCDSSIHNATKETLKAAASRMGLGINDTLKRVETSYGEYERNKATVDGVFTKNGHTIQLGYLLSGEGNTLQIVGDFWGTGIDSESFMGTLGQIYREIEIQTQAELMGYTVDSVTTNAEGDTEIEIFQWA